MKKLKYIALGLSALLLASCAMEEMFDGFGPQEGEEVVMTFKPKFEDFESVTKAIGDASKINALLVHVYEKDRNDYTLISYEFGVQNRTVTEDINIPFYYGKEYEVYFWAYNSNSTAYSFNEDGLKYGVEVNYPDEALDYDSLEELDAFYSYKKIDLTKDSSKQPITLTRPFAQVNFIADKQQLANALATEVVFELPGSTTFTPGQNPAVGNSEQLTFRFKNSEYFQDNEVFTTIDGMDKVYLGTTYIFVGSATSIEAYVTLLDKAGQVLKNRTKVSITLDANCRTNLTFSGIEPAWDDEAMDIPDPDGDGWIHISKPEELAQLLITGTDSETKVHICDDIDLSGIPAEVKAELGSKSFASLTIDGGKYENHNMSGSLLGGGSYMIKNMTAPAFFNEATDLKVRNLTFKGMKVWTAASHVGVIVNTLHGSSSFTNVTVEDSDVSTTNGAAGGMVGYIVRNTPTSRSESVSVSFDNCDLSAVTATGSLTDGKFVGRLSGYDNGEVVTFNTTCSAEGCNSSSMSKYVSSNLACWLTDAERSSFNGWIGDEVYYRGKVSYGDTRVAVKWDGTTTVEPLLANATYDSGTTAGTNRFVVYSAFDLAGVRKKTASPVAIYLKADVDMNGQGADGRFNVPSNFTQSAYSSTDDKVFDPFNYVTTLDGYRDASTNNSIYNLSIVQIEQERAAFVLYASGTTVHKNINFRNCQTVAVHKPVATDAKAYGAILVSNVDATYTMENVHAYDCKVFALQKVGTLGARISGTSTLRNNSVNNCYVENYECDISERFDSGTKEMAGFTARVYADFYPHGEVGGMYGFIQGTSTISNCKVNTTSIYGFGQNDKKATIEGDFLVQVGIAALGYYLVPGRHVSTFIGNIRATGAITITNCKVDSASKCTNRWDTHQWRKQTGGSWLRPTYTYYKWDYIGQAYYVEFLDSKGSVTVDGTALTLGDCKDGTLYGTK